MEIEQISKEDFESYEDVRRSGVVNMFFPDARALAGLDRETYSAIQRHYGELCEKWPDVRDLSGRTDD